MATPRTRQNHSKRVEQIAEEAAAKIAAESPLEEDVIVTIEEVPPTARRETTDEVVAPSAGPLLGSQFAPTRYIETLTALSAANAACIQGIVGAQLRFAGRIADAVSPRTR
jgi:hypothetical protein